MEKLHLQIRVNLLNMNIKKICYFVNDSTLKPGGDLSRVEGRSVKPYWTLLFSDILLFAKVSRDRVLFITEEPIPLANIIDSCFNIRKKREFSSSDKLRKIELLNVLI